MYLLEKQEISIKMLEYPKEIEVYSNIPRVVEQILKVEAKKRLAIKVFDLVDSKPKAV